MLTNFDINPIINYIFSKIGSDGGYLSFQYLDMFESSSDDTYFALATLKLLNKEPQYKDKTIAFLKRLQKKDGSYNSILVAHYSIKTLNILGEMPRDKNGAISFLLESLRNVLKDQAINLSYEIREESLENGILKSHDLTDILTSADLPSILRQARMAIEDLQILGYRFDQTKDIYLKKILSFRNDDGGFGYNRISTLDSTYDGLKALKILGFPVENMQKTLLWTMSCESPEGGFNIRPFVKISFIEYLYYGLSILKIYDKTPKYRDSHVRYVLSLQNGNGGFRRSLTLGISTLENTYYAIASLKMLNFI